MTLMMPGTNAPDPMLGRPMGVPGGGISGLMPLIQRALMNTAITNKSDEVNSAMSRIEEILKPFMGDNAPPTLGAPTTPIGGPMPMPIPPSILSTIADRQKTTPTASAGGALGTTATMARPAYFPMDEDGDGIDQFSRPMQEPMPGMVNPLDFAKSFGMPAPTPNAPTPQPAAPAMQIPGVAGLGALFGR